MLVTLPGHPCYREHLTAEFVQRHRETTTQFCRDNQVTWIDLFADPRFNDGDFFDSHHLNRQGADKATRIIAKPM